MKKIYGLFLGMVLCFMLFGCGNNETLSVKVIVPNGSPALSQVYMENTKPILKDGVEYQIDVVSGQNPLVAAFANQEYDFIYAPSNLGVKMYNNNESYLLLGTTIWGNLYFATCTDEEFTFDSLNNQDITLFGQNTVPSIVANTLLSRKGITLNSEANYVESTANTVQLLVQDKSRIVMVAEPSLSSMEVALAKQGINNLKTINLTTVWKEEIDTDGFPQACVFVKKSFAEEHVDVTRRFAEELAISCVKANEDTANVAKMAVEQEYGFTENVLLSSITRSNITFKSGKDSKVSMEVFINAIVDSGFGTLVGGKLPNEEFYFE